MKISLEKYNDEKITITHWLNSGTSRTGKLIYRQSDNSLSADIQFDLLNPTSLDPIYRLSEAQIRQLKPDNDGYTIKFSDFKDPA